LLLGRPGCVPDGGTSLAAPLVAGLVADARQGQAKPFGFINPVLNAIIGTFDEQSYAMPLYSGQVTQVGYDTMTGLGTPNGQKFITALRALAG